MRYAATDLEIARMCAANPAMPLWPIGFHCEQAVEKCLKGALVLRGVLPAKTHLLLDLAKALAEHGLAPPVALVELARLTPFGIDEKYPRVRMAAVRPGDAEALLALGQAALAWLRALLDAAAGPLA